VQSGLADLRLVARGVHPAVLGQSGLAAALRALPECLDVPVEVTVAEEVPHTRLRTAVEAAAYLAVVDAVERCADTGPEVGGRLPVRVDALIGEEMVVIAVSAAPDGSRPGPALSRVTADRVVALGGAVAAVAGDELTMRTVTVRIPVIG
jgi:signal transduction histidine kinase